MQHIWHVANQQSAIISIFEDARGVCIAIEQIDRHWLAEGRSVPTVRSDECRPESAAAMLLRQRDLGRTQIAVEAL
jgi:hypothetical protein